MSPLKEWTSDANSRALTSIKRAPPATRKITRFWREIYWPTAETLTGAEHSKSLILLLLDHCGTYVNFWPPRAAAAIAPPIGFTKTATPSTNWVLVAVPSFAITADALAPKLN